MISTRLTAATTELTIQMASRLLMPWESSSPARGGRSQAEAQIVQCRQGGDVAHHGKRRQGDDHHQGVGQNVVEDDPPGAGPWARAAIT